MASIELVRLLDIRKAHLSALDRAGVEVRSALWFYDPGSAVRTASPTGLYLRQMEVVGPKDPLVAFLRQAIETGQSIRDPLIRVARTAFNNIPTKEAYIYRIT